MRKFIQVMVSAASIMYAGAALADVAELQAFKLETLSSYWDGKVEVFSDVSGLTRIGLGNAGGFATYFENAGPVNGTADNPFLSFGLNTNAGYRVTGITLSATFRGTLIRAQWNGWEGFADNTGSIYFAATQNGTGNDLFRQHEAVIDLNGERTVLMGGAVSLPSSFVLNIDTWHSFSAQAAQDCSYYPPDVSICHWAGIAKVGMDITDVVLTVQTAPVPEPETYAMLLGGLAVTGFAARRRQRKAQRPA
ncbi:PEP-CTERM sorting domain-containing protein [Massilia sp. YIM B04103]|uniref:PEP-CTERM sorting domain-containing protein n=1 Tax=Massilia sp. YIM B04103 TaxID=2963106 RepID=UPI00210B9A31|nr:PEP-CTERM sorting domain-containing protein [Massilia sp. YIM B04103]